MSVIKLMTIAGARPNFMKVASISEAIDEYNQENKDPSIEHFLVHTGQHYDRKLSECFFDELGLPRPDVNLEVGSASHAIQTSEIMKRFEPVLLKFKPDALIVVGDVNSTIACALVAAKINYERPTFFSINRPLIIHVEAGLRSRDRSMPEEINRILTDALSDLLFVTEKEAINNLRDEGIDEDRIYFVGNVMIDTLKRHVAKARQRPTKEQLNIKDKYGLITLHRPSNVDAKDKLHSLLECLGEISHDIQLIFPLHPRTKLNIERFGLMDYLTSFPGLKLTAPLNYLDFLNLLSGASIVFTDSGGIQEETTVLQVPCITLRENTERPITVDIGTNYLVGTNPQSILNTAKEILAGNGKQGKIPPLWDGQAGQRIVDKIINFKE